MKSSRPVEPQYFDLQGASFYVGGGLSVKALRRLISEPGGLPHYRVRGKILIRRADMDDWLEGKRRTPVDLDKLAAEAVAEITR
jgi:excisionase family DNA binding protein